MTPADAVVRGAECREAVAYGEPGARRALGSLVVANSLPEVSFGCSSARRLRKDAKPRRSR
jgi:hypothetical protein